MMFDSPEMKREVGKQAAGWVMERIMTASVALTRGEDLMGCAEELVRVHGMERAVAQRFVVCFEEWIRGAAEGLQQGGSTEDIGRACADAIHRRVSGGA